MSQEPTRLVVYGLGFDSSSFRVLSHIRGNARDGAEVLHTHILHEDGIVIVHSQGLEELGRLVEERGHVPKNVVFYDTRWESEKTPLPTSLKRVKRVEGSVFYLWDYLEQTFPRMFPA